ncbi:hypothetical protein [Paenibacillus macerans]|uniref:hypothetical protein n=1 Tax=Paenibacillus macerans TaxID=44252 RepID=UPI003D31F56E
MEELKIAEVKGIRDVRVFQICECDAVAAYSLEEALAWYKENTGLAEDELYSVDEMEVVPMDREVYDCESGEKLVSVQELIKRYWNGTPFIALSTEW